MDKSVVFIDSGYLMKIQMNYGFPRIDFLKFSNQLCIGSDRLRTYYYYCMPHQSSPPTEEEKRRYANSEKFIYSIKNLPRFEVKLGRYQKIQTDSKPDYIEKGIDVMFAVDLVRMSWNRQMQKAILVTADSDFLYAVQAARDAGIVTQIYYDPISPINQSFVDVFDERSSLDKAILESCKMPLN